MAKEKATTVDVEKLMAELAALKAQNEELAKKLAAKPGGKELPKWRGLEARQLVHALAVMNKELTITDVNIITTRFLEMPMSPNWISQEVPNARQPVGHKYHKAAPVLNDEQRLALLDAIAKLPNHAASSNGTGQNPDKSI